VRQVITSFSLLQRRCAVIALTCGEPGSGDFVHSWCRRCLCEGRSSKGAQQPKHTSQGRNWCAMRPCVSSGCHSAWGPGADRRARPLTPHTSQGSLDGADLQLKEVMPAIENCRTVALGGHGDPCEDCGHLLIATATAATGIALNVRAPLLPAGWLCANPPGSRRCKQPSARTSTAGLVIDRARSSPAAMGINRQVWRRLPRRACPDSARRRAPDRSAGGCRPRRRPWWRHKASRRGQHRHPSGPDSRNPGR
jgi:hypothetical protein